MHNFGRGVGRIYSIQGGGGQKGGRGERDIFKIQGELKKFRGGLDPG